MSQFVEPQTFLIGYPVIDRRAMFDYLAATGNDAFLKDMQAAAEEGLSDAEIMSSFYAKLCYKSLVLGQNKNLTKTREISKNLESCFSGGHSSVFGHAMLNFVTTNCSRVLTHELVRNHIGTEFSQTSGRYVRGDDIDLIFDKILEPIREEGLKTVEMIAEKYRQMCDAVGLNGEEGFIRHLRRNTDKRYQTQLEAERDVRKRAMEFHAKHGYDPTVEMDFTRKKKLTSALRRFLPNGQSNEIGWSINLRALRHVIQMRTAEGAEWEIRLVFNQVYRLVVAKFPKIFSDATTREAEGLLVVEGMRTQPYQK